MNFLNKNHEHQKINRCFVNKFPIKLVLSLLALGFIFSTQTTEAQILKKLKYEKKWEEIKKKRMNSVEIEN